MEHEKTTTSLVAVLAALLCCFPGCHHSGGPELGQAPSPPPTPPPTKHMKLIIDTLPTGAHVHALRNGQWADTGLVTPFEVALEIDVETKNAREISGRKVDPWDPDATMSLESGLLYRHCPASEGGRRFISPWGNGAMLRFNGMSFAFPNEVFRPEADEYIYLGELLESGDDRYVVKLWSRYHIAPAMPPPVYVPPTAPAEEEQPLIQTPQPTDPGLPPVIPQPEQQVPGPPPTLPPKPPKRAPPPPRQPREVTCPTCGGTGFIVCPGCQGRCYLGKCTVCNGTGQRWVNGTNVGCTNCNSTGRMKCRMCLSADIPQGKIPCKRCNGTGKVTVP